MAQEMMEFRIDGANGEKKVIQCLVDAVLAEKIRSDKTFATGFISEVVKRQALGVTKSTPVPAVKSTRLILKDTKKKIIHSPAAQTDIPEIVLSSSDEDGEPDNDEKPMRKRVKFSLDGNNQLDKQDTKPIVLAGQPRIFDKLLDNEKDELLRSWDGDGPPIQEAHDDGIDETTKASGCTVGGVSEEPSCQSRVKDEVDVTHEKFEKRAKGYTWTDQSTMLLVRYWVSEMKTGNEKYAPGCITALLNQHGFGVTKMQCWNKLKRLKEKYFSIAHAKKTGSYFSLERWPYYELMDSVLSSREPNETDGCVTESEAENDAETHLWTPEATRHLLNLIKTRWNNSEHFGFCETNSEEIAELMKLEGFEVTPEICSRKFESLKSAYQSREKAGATGDFFEVMESISSEIPAQGENHERVSTYGTEAVGNCDGSERKLMEDIKLRTCSIVLDRLPNKVLKLSEESEFLPEILSEGEVDVPKEELTNLRGYRWTDQSTMLLIRTWASEMKRHNAKNAFKRLPKLLEKHGLNVTMRQCLTKFGKLRAKYSSIVRAEKTDYYFKRYPYLQLLHSILSNREPNETDAEDERDGGCVTESETENVSCGMHLPEEEVKHSRGYRWTDRSTMLLLHTWASEVERGNENHVFSRLPKLLKKHGLNLTKLQCQNKFKKLKLKYASVVRANRTGSYFRRYPYLQLMNSVLSKQKNDETDDEGVGGCVTESEAEKGTTSRDTPRRTLPCIQSTKSLASKSETYHWSSEAVLKLLELYQDKRTPAELTSSGVVKLWVSIAKDLRKAGYYVVGPECYFKLRQLREEYSTSKQPNNHAHHQIMEEITSRNPFLECFPKAPLIMQIKTEDGTSLDDSAPKWSRKALHLFLQICQKMNVATNVTSGGKDHIPLWQTVSKELASQKCLVTWVHCAVQFHILKNSYFAIAKGKLKERVKFWEVFEPMDSVMSNLKFGESEDVHEAATAPVLLLPGSQRPKPLVESSVVDPADVSPSDHKCAPIGGPAVVSPSDDKCAPSEPVSGLIDPKESEELASIMLQRLIQKEEHEQAKRLRHAERMEMDRKFLGILNDLAAKI